RRRVRWHDRRAGVHRVLYPPGLQPEGVSAGVHQRNGVATLAPVDIDVGPYHELLATRWVECSVICRLV
ncbi:MAG: hypothetical protein ACK55I_06050, partial [bacterium]